MESCVPLFLLNLKIYLGPRLTGQVSWNGMHADYSTKLNACSTAKIGLSRAVC